VTERTDIAVFDLDGTLAPGNIGAVFVRYLLRRGACGLRARLLVWLIYPLYRLGLLDFKYALLLGAYALCGLDERRVEELARECFEREIKARVFADGLREIARCKEQGRIVVLATGAHQAIASVFAAYAGADRLVAASSAVKAGRYTLFVHRPLPYREGKRDLVAALIREYPGKAHLTVYTDEEKDLALLRLADAPVAVNADGAVRDYVASRGGRIVAFR
jgi:phosphoserine phosphatase